MNRSIIRLFGVVILLFMILVAWTSRWTVFSATALQNNPLNRLEFYASLKVKRGPIIADNGAVLAKSVKAGGGTWSRKYPYGSLFAQAVGYYFLSEGQHDRARVMGAQLRAGGTSRARSRASSARSTAAPRSVMRCTQHSTRRRRRWRASWCSRRCPRYGATAGSVVAIVPQTGAVKVLYSYPSYNDNNPGGLRQDAGLPARATTPRPRSCRRARRSSSSQPPPRSTAASTHRYRCSTVTRRSPFRATRSRTTATPVMARCR